MNVELSDFTEYGLAGLVIAALLYLINKYIEDTKVMRKEHREERKEWNESQEKRDEKLERAITGLEAAFREQSNRYRKND
jgi:hypothetical protein